MRRVRYTLDDSYEAWLETQEEEYDEDDVLISCPTCGERFDALEWDECPYCEVREDES